MNVYLIHIDRRDGESTIRGVYDSRKRAIEGLKFYCYTHYSEKSVKKLCENFGGNPEEGHFATEEENINITEHHLKTDHDIDGDIA